MLKNSSTNLALFESGLAVPSILKVLCDNVPLLGLPELALHCPWWKFAAHLLLIFFIANGLFLKARPGTKKGGVNKSKIKKCSPGKKLWREWSL